MPTVLDVKVGSKVRFRDYIAGAEVEAKVIELPKIIRVKTEDGTVYDIRPDQVIAEGPPKRAGRFGSKFL